MGVEAIIAGIIGILVTVIPAIVLYLKRKRSTRDALATTEADELDAGIADLDRRVQPPPPKL